MKRTGKPGQCYISTKKGSKKTQQHLAMSLKGKLAEAQTWPSTVWQTVTTPELSTRCPVLQ